MAKQKVRRHTSRTLLHFLGTQHVQLNHELWHIAKNPHSGLSDAEVAYLETRLRMMEKMQVDIGKLRKRLSDG